MRGHKRDHVVAAEGRPTAIRQARSSGTPHAASPFPCGSDATNHAGSDVRGFVVGIALSEATLTVAAEDAAFFAGAFGPGAVDPGSPVAAPPLAGWHVAALGMRLLFDAVLHRTAGQGAPGIEGVTWPHPVWPGDRLRFTAGVTAARISASRPEMGLVTVAIALFNQDGACVMTQESVVMVERRDRGARGRTETRT